MVLETKRLYLRELTEADFDALYRVLADSDIMQHYPYTFDEARVRGWIQKNIERYSIFGFGLWAVCLRETGEMIGDCGLTIQLIDGQIRPEIGYHIRKDRQRQGYAKEAAIAVRDWTHARRKHWSLRQSCMISRARFAAKSTFSKARIETKVGCTVSVQPALCLSGGCRALFGGDAEPALLMLVDLYVSEACLFQRGVGTGGSVTGYGGGVARKVKLLELERTDMRGLFVPTHGTAL